MNEAMQFAVKSSKLQERVRTAIEEISSGSTKVTYTFKLESWPAPVTVTAYTVGENTLRIDVKAADAKAQGN